MDSLCVCYPTRSVWTSPRGSGGCLYASAMTIHPTCPPYPDTLATDLPRFNRMVADSGAARTPNRTFGYALASRKTMAAESATFNLTHLKRAICGAETIHIESLVAFADKFDPAGFDPTTAQRRGDGRPHPPVCPPQIPPRAVVIEGEHSMGGDIPDLPVFVALKRRTSSICR
ncbi:hypothetical protein H257_05120 [Aphanomyces astaci]|uniref:Uncharacterized protein n=1 Tax=Aphanomyces astaci TaxID=112090 RepID=W4GS40_APHAT|nr:hypothetical protein H257_05120 [Aphanomyces astaci]ETV82512.1 hypothetical protein H257_05120 [Aphanomyces astaci]|eukprot:XP_009828181.1 hypothetical protein H257_05120 [Aphanomyces astaci]